MEEKEALGNEEAAMATSEVEEWDECVHSRTETEDRFVIGYPDQQCAANEIVALLHSTELTKLQFLEIVQLAFAACRL